MTRRKSTRCLNCGFNTRDANYCPKCGQINTHKRISIRQILKEFLGDYFTFDSKVFRSLFPLVFKPGYLAREYTSGRRVSYILPLRLYIFITFIFFFVLMLNSKIDQKNMDNLYAVQDRDKAVKDSLICVLNKYSHSISKEIRGEIITKYDSAYAISKRNGQNHN